MEFPTSVTFRAGGVVFTGLLVAIAVLGSARQSLTETNSDWAGKRVVAKLDATLQADGAKGAEAARGTSKTAGRIYRVAKAMGASLSLVDEDTGAAYLAPAESVVPVEAAVDGFTNELKRNPKNTVAYVGRGRLWREQGEFDKAIADCDEAVRLNATDAAAYAVRGGVWLDKKRYDKSIDDFSEAIRLDAKDATVYNNRGAAYFANKEVDHALDDYSAAIRLAPEYTSAYFNRAVAWRAVKEYDQAIADFTEIVRLDPSDWGAFYSRGNVWSDKHEFDKSIADYSEAIRLNPKSAVAYFNRALAWRAKNNLDKAIADQNEAIRLDPNDATSYFNRAFAYRMKQDFAKAIADFGEAIRLNPKNVFAYFNRGLMLEHANELDKAISDFDEAIRLDPKDGLSYAQRAKTLGRKGEYEKAARDFDEAVRFDPEQPLVQLNRGITHLILRRPEATNAFQAVIQFYQGKSEYSTYAVIFGHFAAQLIGDEAKAAEFLELAPQVLNHDAWPYPAVKLLRGEMSEAAFFAAATDNDKRTEARCYVGLDHLIKGQNGLAWITFAGFETTAIMSFSEYKIAVSEIERMDKAGGKNP